MDLLRIGICDDDPIWHQTAETIIKNYTTNVGIKVELVFFSDKTELLGYDGMPLDSIFMDIELESENGIELSLILNDRWPGCAIVYVTNFIFYASDSYNTEHIYFVLKERFEQKLPSIFDKILHAREQVKNKMVFEIIGENNHKLIVSPKDILYFERNRRKTIIHTVWGNYEVWDKIGDIEKSVSPIYFVRCHNSYIVYLPATREVTSTNIVMKNGVEISISRNFALHTKTVFTKWASTQMI